MASKPRPPLTGLTSGASALSKHVAQKGETHDAPAREVAKTGGKMRYMQTRLSETGWKSLKMLSLEQQRPLQGLVLEALNDLLRRYGKEPNVTGPEIEEK